MALGSIVLAISMKGKRINQIIANSKIFDHFFYKIKDVKLSTFQSKKNFGTSLFPGKLVSILLQFKHKCDMCICSFN